MVRLMLVLAPALCCLSGVAVSDALTTFLSSIKQWIVNYMDNIDLEEDEEEEETVAAPKKGGKGAAASGESKKVRKEGRAWVCPFLFLLS